MSFVWLLGFSKIGSRLLLSHKTLPGGSRSEDQNLRLKGCDTAP
jgi:hypothetical protein